MASHFKSGGRLRNRRGSVVVVAAAAMLMLASFGLFVLDAGMIYRQKRVAQTAADAAALAAAWELFRGWGSDSVQAHAMRASADNGFTNGTGGVTVVLSNPPTAGSYLGDGRFVEAKVNQTYTTSGLRLFGINTVPIAARAVAGGGGSAAACVTILEPANVAVDMTSSARLTPNCGMTVNSTSGAAIHMSSSAQITVPSSSRIGVTGNYQLQSSARIVPSGNVVTGMPPVPDPFASVAGPAVPSTCTQVNYSLSSSSTATIGPGTYCNGIIVRSSARLTLQPGVYILCGNAGGSGFNFVTQSSAIVTGTGVMFYFTRCVAGATTYGYAPPVSTASSSSIRVSAITSSSAYAGILFFQDRAAPTTLGASSWSSSASTPLDGVLYMPNSAIIFQSSSAMTASAIVARTIQLNSSANVEVDNDFGFVTGGSPIKRVTLVE